MSTVASLLTIEAFLARPEAGVDRERINGESREYSTRLRNRKHGRIEAKLTFALESWLQSQAEPQGEVVVGEAGFVLSHEPGSGVGIDVAYVSNEMIAQTPQRAPDYNGRPILAVEVLSPSDRQEADRPLSAERRAAGVDPQCPIPGPDRLSAGGRARAH